VLVSNVLSAAKFVNDDIKKDENRFELICAHNWQSALAGATMIHHSEEAAAKVADRIITVSYPLHDYLIMHGCAAEKLRVCWNTVDCDYYDPDTVDPKRLHEFRARYGIAPGGLSCCCLQPHRSRPRTCSTCFYIIPAGDDQTGILADSSDPADLAMHLRSLLDHPEQAEKLGRRGRMRVKAYQAWDEIAARTSWIYEEALAVANSCPHM